MAQDQERQIHRIAIGLYHIILDISTDITSGSGRSTSMVRLTTFNGISTYTELPGSHAYMYNREAAHGENSCTINYITQLNAGDILVAQALRNSGTSTIKTIPNACRLTMLLIAPPTSKK